MYIVFILCVYFFSTHRTDFHFHTRFQDVTTSYAVYSTMYPVHKYYTRLYWPEIEINIVVHTCKAAIYYLLFHFFFNFHNYHFSIWNIFSAYEGVIVKFARIYYYWFLKLCDDILYIVTRVDMVLGSLKLALKALSLIIFSMACLCAI